LVFYPRVQHLLTINVFAKAFPQTPSLGVNRFGHAQSVGRIGADHHTITSWLLR